MNKDKIKSKLSIKDVITSRITIGVLCFALGGMLLGGKGGIDITKERYNELLEIEKKGSPSASGDSEAAKETASNATDNKDKKDNKTKNNKGEVKTSGLGETVTFSNKDGVEISNLTINSAKLTDKRNEFSDKKADKVIIVEYTYENLDKPDNLSIQDLHFKAYDASGNILESYPSTEIKHAQNISKGKKCTASMAFALNNDSNEVELEYYDNMFDKKAAAKFKVTAE